MSQLETSGSGNTCFLKMRINRETRAGEVACCHWDQATPSFLLKKGTLYSSVQREFPLVKPQHHHLQTTGYHPLGVPPFWEPSFWGAVLGVSPICGVILLRCQLLRSNPFGCCVLGCCPIWGAVLLGCCPFGVPSFLGGVLLRYHPYQVRSLGCHPFCADCVFPKGNAGVQCYNGNILFYTVTQAYNVYCPLCVPATSELVGRNSSVQAAVCPMWGRLQLSQRPVIVLSPWEKEAPNVIYLCTCCTSCHGYWRKATVATADLSKGPCQYWITENKRIGWEINPSHRKLDSYWLCVQPTVYITHSSQSLA